MSWSGVRRYVKTSTCAYDSAGMCPALVSIMNTTHTTENGTVLTVGQTVTCGSGAHKLIGTIGVQGFIGVDSHGFGTAKCWFVPSNGGAPEMVYADDCEAA